MYADGEYTVVYECFKVLEDGTCDPSKTYLEIVSRFAHPNMDSATKSKLMNVARKTCIEPGDLVQIKQKGIILILLLYFRWPLLCIFDMHLMSLYDLWQLFSKNQ